MATKTPTPQTAATRKPPKRGDAGSAPGAPQPAAPTVSAASESWLVADQRAAIDALRRYVADHGQLPISKQPPDELPTLWTIRQLFGSWNRYVTAAGFTARPYRAWNHADTIAAIQRWAQSHDGKPPSRAQWTRPSRIHPSERQVRRLFGTWSAAIRQAGLSPQRGRPGHWTDEAILEALRGWADLHGVPSSASWSKSAPGRPTHALVIRTFGSWEAALHAAGLQRPPTGRWPAEQIIDAIQSWTQSHQLPPGRSTGNTPLQTIQTGSMYGNTSDHGTPPFKPPGSHHPRSSLATVTPHLTRRRHSPPEAVP